MKNFKTGTKEAEDEVEALNKSIKSFEPKHIVKASEALGSLAGLAGNTVTVINSISSAIKTLSDPDLSGWEKFSAFLSTVSFTIPAITSSIKGFTTI